MRHPVSRRAPSSRSERTSLYDEVTNRILSELEAGRFPWAQPWGRSSGAAPGLPRNALTGRSYSGVNVLILWGAVTEQGWLSQRWLTFRQALEAGGCVRKGEHGTAVVYADRFTPEAEKARARETGDEARAVPFLKKFTVFNVAQCEGLPEALTADPAPLSERQIVAVAEALIAATGANIRIGGDKAFYAPVADLIRVPPQQAFHDQINFYRTCFHELAHWSGHASRLNRDLSGIFGSAPYAKEELVALSGQSAPLATLQ
ncbi:ArdC family protein [Rhizorhabdus dicambivorans]|uniref:DUF1738 domain-containing protein n=1 Tax=Rhizorhabdus dicambivorans TaxID=1850238 RepID=A0A2A4FQD6_9SPHN|nr:ArdC-like ssDNA-binding domain-containing protein [Rhizorhabdus dicambivorans]ATE65163.1 DUF1738 domain-containing protein [Rhizorhabdus dicambivorans]PCE39886.1 DUF1738 domain-containing protein [Rhizorhabdus dicambivorans]